MNAIYFMIIIQNYLDAFYFLFSNKLKGSLLRNLLLGMSVFSMLENLSITTSMKPKNRRVLPEVFLGASYAMGWWASMVPHDLMGLVVGVLCQLLLGRQGKLTRSKQTSFICMFFFGVFLLSQLSFNFHKYSYALRAKHVGSPPVPNGPGSIKLFTMAYSLKQRILWQRKVVKRDFWKNETDCV